LIGATHVEPRTCGSRGNARRDSWRRKRCATSHNQESQRSPDSLQATVLKVLNSEIPFGENRVVVTDLLCYFMKEDLINLQFGPLSRVGKEIRQDENVLIIDFNRLLAPFYPHQVRVVYEKTPNDGKCAAYLFKKIL
jgi:hypothetical protein